MQDDGPHLVEGGRLGKTGRIQVNASGHLATHQLHGSHSREGQVVQNLTQGGEKRCNKLEAMIRKPDLKQVLSDQETDLTYHLLRKI